MIVECLRYWVTTYRVDGFRFDLASILGRNEDGTPMDKPPLLQTLAFDPILGDVKLIAEAWDAGGLYQVGNFPSWKRWSEWNGKYRDDLRDFLKGGYWKAPEAALRISGSSDLYNPFERGTNASINFITCHDGFHYMICTHTITSTTKQTAGTTQTAATTTGAGTAAQRATQRSFDFKTPLPYDQKRFRCIDMQPWDSDVLIRR